MDITKLFLQDLGYSPRSIGIWSSLDRAGFSDFSVFLILLTPTAQISERSQTG